jgi:hypothetical protein
MSAAPVIFALAADGAGAKEEVIPVVAYFGSPVQVVDSSGE